MPVERQREPIKFAYWVPNVSGGLVISSIEQRTSWEIDYNRKLAQIAERVGLADQPGQFGQRIGAARRRAAARLSGTGDGFAGAVRSLTMIVGHSVPGS